MSNSAFSPSVLTVPSTGTTGSAGELNLVTNPSAASDLSGWVGAGRGTSGGPLNPSISTYFTVLNTAAAESSTSGGYSVLSLPSGFQNRKLKVEFYYTSPANDTFKVSVYKGTTRVPLSTDVSGSTSLPAGTTGKFTAYFDTDSSGTWTLSVTRTAGTGSTALQFTSVIVGPGIQPQGAVVGEWQSYTPTISPLSGFTSGPAGQYRRVGANMDVQISFKKNASAGTGGALLFSLPSGFNLDTTKFPPSADTQPVFGTANGYNALTLNQYDRALSVMNIVGNTTAVGIVKPASSLFIAGTDILANGELNLTFSVPIAQWAGSGTVQLAQNDVEYAASTSGTWDAASSAAQTVYGPSGAPITGALAANRSKVVRFQTPIQSGDSLVIEFRRAGTNVWIAQGSSEWPYLSGPTYSFGPKLEVVTGTTDVTVIWYRYQTTPTWNSITSASDYSNAVYDAWRVRKSSAGAAVGFGLYQPGVSAGLVSSSGLAGRADGNAVPSGFVGEDKSTNIAISSVLNSNGAAATLATVTLTKGTWLIGYALTGKITISNGANDYVSLAVETRRNNVILLGLSSEITSDELASSPTLGVRGALSGMQVYTETSDSSTITLLAVLALSGTGTGQINPNTNSGRFTIFRIA